MLSGRFPVRRLGYKERVQHSGDTARISICTGDRWPVINAASSSATGESTMQRKN